MIRRTLIEWNSIAYGEDDETIPQWAADRIAGIASKSPLAGRGGTKVLEHGRKSLRAGQVVGVIAAENCVLEILPKIDFPDATGEQAKGRIRRQLVHMLSVALDIDIAPGAVTDLGWQREDLLEILIRLFSEKLLDAVRQGMPRRYVGHEEDLPNLRGQLDTVRQFTTLAASPHRLACRFDALSHDIALNRIMKAAVTRVARVSRSPANQRRLRELAFSYADITNIPVAALRWDEVVLDRTNGRWRELLNLAKLLLGERFQTTSSGAERGFSLLFEMNVLFEEYVARMLKRVLSGTGLSVVSQGGRLYCLEEIEGGAKRFQTKPDILVKRGGDVVQIIDTKWKRIAAKMDDPKQGVKEADVYQMMAYGRVYDCAALMLLYPHHAPLGESPTDAQHRIATPGCADILSVATVDVTSHAEVRRCLRKLLAGYVLPLATAA